MGGLVVEADGEGVCKQVGRLARGPGWEHLPQPPERLAKIVAGALLGRRGPQQAGQSLTPVGAAGVQYKEGEEGLSRARWELDHPTIRTQIESAEKTDLKLGSLVYHGSSPPAHLQQE
jgi:hypothetical protein